MCVVQPFKYPNIHSTIHSAIQLFHYYYYYYYYYLKIFENGNPSGHIGT